MREDKSIFYNLDWILVGMFLLLVLFGWLNIYAAVFNEEHPKILDFSQKYGKQLMWIFGSFFLAIIILMLDGRFYTTFAYPIYGISILFLISVIFLGTEIKGSHSWFAIGSFRIQPAEFSKFASCMALAKFLGNLNVKMDDLKTKFIAVLIIAVPPLIIILQNETGSALVYAAFFLVLYREGLSGNFLLLGLLIVAFFIFALLVDKLILISILAGIAAIMLFITRRKKKYSLIILGVFIAISGFVFSVNYLFENKLQAHQKQRIDVLLGKKIDNKGAGYNVNQSKIAIGSGGFWGKGFLEGTQTKFDFVPEQSTDFIFCTIGEEHGFVGTVFVIILFMLFLFRIVFIAERQRSIFSRIYGYGLASIIFFHLLVNIGMTIGLAPIIGIPLPFFSYGGSSLWAFTILLFIFIKLDAYRLEILR